MEQEEEAKDPPRIKGKKICRICHHYRESPGANLKHCCPKKENGEPGCRGWELCPTAFRKGHPDVDPKPQTHKKIDERIKELTSNIIEESSNDVTNIPVSSHYKELFERMEKENQNKKNDPSLKDTVVSNMKEFVLAKQHNITPEGAKKLHEHQKVIESISRADKFPSKKEKKEEKKKEDETIPIIDLTDEDFTMKILSSLPKQVRTFLKALFFVKRMLIVLLKKLEFLRDKVTEESHKRVIEEMGSVANNLFQSINNYATKNRRKERMKRTYSSMLEELRMCLWSESACKQRRLSD